MAKNLRAGNCGHPGYTLFLKRVLYRMSKLKSPHFRVNRETPHFHVKNETAPFFTLLGYTKMGRFHVLQENGAIYIFTRKWREFDVYIR